jgi:hypothetical protein
MIKTLLIDINAVLFEQSEKFSVRYSQTYNLPIEILNEFLDSDFDLCLTGKKDLKESLQPLLIKWQWNGSVDQLLDFWFDENHNSLNKMIQTFKTLKKKGAKLYLATQNEKYRATKYISYLKPLLDYDENVATYLISYKNQNLNILKLY